MSKLAGMRPRIDTILVVDDEEDIRDSLAAVLEASLEGTKVLTAPGGREGLAILRETKVDVVLSDFKMPGMDGLEFLGQAAKVQPQAPRILITAYPELNVGREAVENAQVSNFLTKPVSPDTLIEALNAAVVKSRQNHSWANAFQGDGDVPLRTLGD